MKQTKTRILCLLLAMLMLLVITACGKDKTSADPNLLTIGDYTLLYKNAYITEDYDGNDALVLTLDYTNNGKENASYLWSISETAMQNGVQLDSATIFTDFDAYETLRDDQMKEVAPGATLEIQIAFVLDDTANPVEVTFEQPLGKKGSNLTVDPSTLNREVTSDRGNETTKPADVAETGDALLEWWNGEWYGWWMMNGCYGYYEGMDGQWWDICGVIDIGSDYTGTVTLWDEDYTRSEPMVFADVSLNEAGTGEHGTLYSEGGQFTNIDLAHADWIVDPGLMSYTDMDYDGFICIDGWYENGDDEYKYEIYLRPWGMKWDDVAAESQPYYYDSWYLPLVEAGESMPGSIGAEAVNGNTENVQTQNNGSVATNAPSGDGIVTEEQVQKGYVWMSSVVNDIFNITYEDLVDYFGVDGAFDKEEYSDHMQKNYRFYSWISSEDSTHFIYVNFEEEEPGVYKVSAFNTSGFSGDDAKSKYLDTVKAEAAEADKAAAANAVMKDFSVEISDFFEKIKVKITTTIPETGWSYSEYGEKLVQSDDPDAFGVGRIHFELKDLVGGFDLHKDEFENYQEIEDRVIGGITFKGRTYKYIGYQWIEYVAQIDDNRALSIALWNMDCFPGTMPDIILNNMKFQ